ncbi:MAG TPA: ATP-binding protein [Jatrophihabitantaceae bacterium]|nr:ATP-binding protein [Jatrophihabitantaceae bacterium]
MALKRRGTTPLPVPPPPANSVPAAVAANQTLASLVVEALDSGVIVLDTDDRAVLVNPAARAMGVLDVDRLAFSELIALVETARARRVPVVQSVDLPIGRLGREPIALSVTTVALAPIGSHDEHPPVAVLLTDVSEQRRLDAVRRDFVANVSHELKTPVGALTLLAEAIQDAAEEPSTVARFAGRMQHEGARLTRLVGELMELSRVQGVDPMPGTATVDVKSIVDDAADRCRLAAEQAVIDVEVHCEPDLQVRGDDAQLRTAVANLVDNAIAYSPPNTRVVVTARPGSDDQAKPCVDIAVTDQGLGIAESDLDRIFERFYRVDPARSRATGGTGLGLAIVKNIVTNHLGSVSVRSVVGSGSTFTVRLPRVHPDQSPFPEDEATTVAATGVQRGSA